MRGKVKAYKFKPGGTIVPEDGTEEVHVEYKDLVGLNYLLVGQTVEFNLEVGRNGPVAKNVTLVEGDT
eukprot:g5702.t1